MFVLCFAFALIALAIASNFFKKPWTWIVTAIVTFALTAISFKFKLVGLIITIASLTIVFEIYFIIQRFINKRK